MELLNFDKSKSSKEILKELEGKMFFAVSIVDNIYELHTPSDMFKSQIIYGCEYAKHVLFSDSLIPNDEKEEL
jgi:hypothetical protein